MKIIECLNDKISEELSDVLMMKALEDDNGRDTWGSAGFLWVILIFLFFLAFNGGGLFGNRGFGNGAAVVANDLSQVERDVLTGNCATQKEVLENRYTNQLSFNQLGAQMQSCCCDIKTTIIEQNQLTRDLIQSQYLDELRTKLSDAKSQISNMEQNQYILGQLGNFYSKPSVNPNTCYNNYGCGCNSCGGCNGCGCN